MVENKPNKTPCQRKKQVDEDRVKNKKRMDELNFDDEVERITDSFKKIMAGYYV